MAENTKDCRNFKGKLLLPGQNPPGQVSTEDYRYYLKFVATNDLKYGKDGRHSLRFVKTDVSWFGTDNSILCQGG